MADDVRITNMPNSGSHEAVALELWKALRTASHDIDEQLKLFIKCRKASYGTPPS
jgi:hypothetical protein